MLTFSVNKSTEDVMKVMHKIKNFGDGQWVGEAYLNCLDGRGDNININAYSYVCERNTRMAKQKREVAVVTVTEISDGVQGVSENVMSYWDTNIDKLCEDAEVVYNIRQFVEMYDYLMVEEGINLWALLQSALSGAHENSTKKFRSIVETFKLSDMIKSILGSSGGLQSLSIAMEAEAC